LRWYVVLFNIGPVTPFTEFDSVKIEKTEPQP